MPEILSVVISLLCLMIANILIGKKIADFKKEYSKGKFLNGISKAVFSLIGLGLIYISTYVFPMEIAEINGEMVTTLSKDLLDNVDDIILSGEPLLIRNFIDNNKELLNKRIIIDNRFDYDENEYNNIMINFGDIKKLSLISEGNIEPISITEYKQTIDIINQIVNKVNQYNFSPLEKLIYVYDIVRDKIYKKESSFESARSSRDITKSLLGENIVCEGFSRIFNEIVTKLDISSNIIIIGDEERKSYHVRNKVYINDPKYKVEGIYYFDTTWDSKKRKNSKDYINSYKYCAKTLKDMEKYNKEHNRDYSESTLLNREFIDYINSIDISNRYNLCLNLELEYIKIINHHSMLVDKKIIIDNLKITEPSNMIISDLNRYLDLYNKPIPAETFLNAFYTVRKQEYYENPDKFLFNRNIFEQVLILSDFLGDISYSEYVLRKIFNEPLAVENKMNELLNNLYDSNNAEVDIQRTKLTKILSKIRDNKKNS